jgi:hypothetical protein
MAVRSREILRLAPANNPQSSAAGIGGAHGEEYCYQSKRSTTQVPQRQYGPRIRQRPVGGAFAGRAVPGEQPG